MSSDSLLVLDGVFAGYGKMTILNGTTAHIRRAAITTVIGPNGAGKSTMFKTIFGLLSVRNGTITLDGRAITNFSPRQVRDQGVTILLIEQNAKQALQISDYGLVLEQGQTRIEDTAPNILADPRIAQLFLGGGLAQPERVP